jgi:hypothetical protein
LTFAFGVVPRQENIFGLNWNAFPRKLFADFCDEFLLLGLVDDRNAVDHEHVVEAVVIVDLVSGGELRPGVYMGYHAHFASMSE